MVVVTEPQLQADPRNAVSILKLAAARRQLDAAIRMTFANEDELAVHTVAAAAYRILRDLLAKRKLAGQGRHDLEDVVRAGLYSFAHSLARGEMSDTEVDGLKRQDPQLYPIVIKVAEDIKIHGDKVTPDDVPVRLSESDKKSDWQSMFSVANFLKHADHDTFASLSLDKVDNANLLMRACTAYLLVSHTSTPEMHVFIIYSWLASEYRTGIEGDGANKLADALEKLSPARRRSACTKLIRSIKTKSVDSVFLFA
jgi:hypothetical protein